MASDQQQKKCVQNQTNQFPRLILTELAQEYQRELSNQKYLYSNRRNMNQIKELSLKQIYLQPEVKIIPTENSYKVLYGKDPELSSAFQENFNLTTNLMRQSTNYYRSQYIERRSVNEKKGDKFLPNLARMNSTYLKQSIKSLNKDFKKQYQNYLSTTPFSQTPQSLSFSIYKMIEQQQQNNINNSLYCQSSDESQKTLSQSQSTKTFDILSSKKKADDKYCLITSQNLQYSETKLARMLSNFENKKAMINKISERIKKKLTKQESEDKIEKIKFYEQVQDFKTQVSPQVQQINQDEKEIQEQKKRLKLVQILLYFKA